MVNKLPKQNGIEPDFIIYLHRITDKYYLNMKKIYFLIVFTLQFSLFCFSQSEDASHHYTDAEILKLSDYVKGLEAKKPVETLTEPEKSLRRQIAGLFIKTPHDYTDAEVIKLADYIKHLENPDAVVAATTNPVEPLTAYTDPEIEKFANYIKVLEKKTETASPDQTNPEEKKLITELLSAPSHEYNDAEIIMLANYIKHLEKLDSANTLAIAKIPSDSVAVANINNDTAAIADVTNPDNKNNNLIIAKEKEIAEIAKLIFFNFDSSTITKESFGPLEDVVKIVKSQVKLNFIVEGYCDSVGTDAYNLNLSKRRAGAVKNYFISKGISSSRMSSIGYGEANPIATNDTDEGRAKNRRVEIKTKK